MKRFGLFLVAVLLSTSRVFAGAAPNGGHIYLNCENFQVGGDANFFGTANKTLDNTPAAGSHGKGACVLVFSQGTTQTATAKFFYPHSMVAGTSFLPNFHLQINSGTNTQNVCMVSKIACNTPNTDLSNNNGTGGVFSSIDEYNVLSSPYKQLLSTGGQATAPQDLNLGVFTCLGECADYPCTLLIERASCLAFDDPAAALVYGVDLQYDTP